MVDLTKKYHNIVGHNKVRYEVLNAESGIHKTFQQI